MLDRDLEKLAEKISALDKPSLSNSKNFVMKDSILSQIKKNTQTDTVLSSERPLISYVKWVSKNVFMDRNRKFLLKEKIMGIIDKSSSIGYFSWICSFGKRATTMALLFLMVFSLFAFWNVDTNVVHAYSITKLDSYSGDLSLEREGELIDVYAGMEIYADDQILTGGKSEAVIKYLDDSVSRLSENTSVAIEKLESLSATKTNVAISIDNGAVWNRVVNLVDDDSSFVVEVDNTYIRAKKSAFNVEFIDDEVEIEVYKNLIELENENSVSPEKLISGYKAKVVRSEDIEVEKITKSEKELAWVKDNLMEDKVHIAEVEEKVFIARKEIVEQIDVENDDKIERKIKPTKDLIAADISHIEEKKDQLEEAEKAFVAAELKLRDENLTELEIEGYRDDVEAFVDEVDVFYDLVEEVGDKDESVAEDLDDYMDEKIVNHKKDLALVLPDSDAYKAKEVIEDIEQNAAVDDAELVDIKIDKAFDKLSEAEDLIEKGDYGKASEALSDYNDEINEAVEVIAGQNENNEDIEYKEEKAKEIEKAADYVEVLKSDVNESADNGEDKEKFESEIKEMVEEKDLTLPELTGGSEFKSEPELELEPVQEIKVPNDESLKVFNEALKDID